MRTKTYLGLKKQNETNEMKTNRPPPPTQREQMCFDKFWIKMCSKLPFPECPAISLDGRSLSLINLCSGGYTLWIPPQKRLLVTRGLRGSGPFSTVRLFFCVVPLIAFLSPDLLFSLYSPSARWKSWKMRISLTLLLCQLSGCCTCSELEESMLLSNPFAPHVKDKKQDAWL